MPRPPPHPVTNTRTRNAPIGVNFISAEFFFFGLEEGFREGVKPERVPL